MPLSVDGALKALREAGFQFSANGGNWRLHEISLSSGELILFADIIARTRSAEITATTEPQ